MIWYRRVLKIVYLILRNQLEAIKSRNYQCMTVIWWYR
jgi:hypothetical protein